MSPKPLAPLPDNARVGVALCTHNGDRFIAAQMKSILSQTYPVSEIVVGDDDSGDNTLTIIENLVENYNQAQPKEQVKLVVRRHKPALGVRQNFSDALSATTAEVVLLCDQDDEWDSQKVETLLAGLNCANLVHTDAVLIDAEGADLGKTLFGELRVTRWEAESLAEANAFEVLLRRNLITGATVAMRGDFARTNLPVEPGLLHDEWFAMMAALDDSLRLIPAASRLTRYRQHGGNQIGAKRMGMRDRWEQLTAGSTTDNQRRLTRAQSLLRAAEARHLGTAEQRHDLALSLQHQRVRSALPRLRLARLPGIAREATRGHYRRYSRGWLTMVRDFLTRSN